jgi:3-hydroxyisobutyrate dehydrogenase-like beta-hydroxyacid dehydrogenase
MNISFVGFGEAGQAIAAGLRETGVESVAAWDILFPELLGKRLKRAATSIGVRVARSPEDAVKEAELVVSAVTAASSLDAARSVQDSLCGRPFYLDINSVSPGRKQETDRLFGGRARYIDAAVMGAIHPSRHQTPMLLAGRDATAILPLLQKWGMRVSDVGPEVGAAAAIKMVRSVMIKGMEALTIECFLAAFRAGVEDHVIASLAQTFPTLDWPRLIDYNLERMATHGARRAAEMEEVTKTLRELGVDPLMVTATVKRQREMGKLGKQAPIRSAVGEGRGAALSAISKAVKDRH